MPIAVVKPLDTRKARRHDLATSRGSRLVAPTSSCCAVPLRLRAHCLTTLTRSRSSIVAGIVHRASCIVHRAVRGLADHHRDITHHGHDPDVEDDDDDDAPAPAWFRHKFVRTLGPRADAARRLSWLVNGIIALGRTSQLSMSIPQSTASLFFMIHDT